ncbi:hypothetical protein PGTUg99_007710 [Puccinia graminis f. sp. tritici]|uniref:Uncharacterized protein n=1 Tax=Puccinia graminis f. sp. tritici TaxID=56615 RepID=A0A5B0PHH9_PUCGR|nr:hypothetical protein PGTUg99_007710 [Puccinia graminis f. sp. tritici]
MSHRTSHLLPPNDRPVEKRWLVVSEVKVIPQPCGCEPNDGWRFAPPFDHRISISGDHRVHPSQSPTDVLEGREPIKARQGAWCNPAGQVQEHLRILDCSEHSRIPEMYSISRIMNVILSGAEVHSANQS